MKLREHQAKDVFARYGIPVPLGMVVTTVDAAVQAAAPRNSLRLTFVSSLLMSCSSLNLSGGAS